MDLHGNPKKFEKHFLMDVEAAKEYTEEVLRYFPRGAELIGSEIGDGNINYVFRIREKSSGKSLILKQGDALLRSSKRPLSRKRTEIEAKVMMGYEERSPGLSPKVYHYDPQMSVIAMEDLKDLDNLREGLGKQQVYPNLVEDVTTFIVENSLKTSLMVLQPGLKRQIEKQFINDEMCEISEALVFSEPFNNDKGRNQYVEENEEFLKKTLYEDEELHGKVGMLKEIFINRKEALIHGDLHTGSIFVSEYETKVFDGEFAFFGPISYDLGNFLGNLFFPMAYHRVGKSVEEYNTIQFLVWLEKSIKALLKTFSLYWCRRINEEAKDPLFKTSSFQRAYFDRMLEETIAMAGLEMIRRAIGDARVPEVTQIDDVARRKKVERVLVLTGKAFILNKNNLRRGEELIEEFEKSIFEVDRMEAKAHVKN